MKITHQILYGELKKAALAGMNVIMQGPHGSGKTSLVMQVAEELGLNLKYYSSSTLDPFVDIVGVPVPYTDESGHRHLEFHRLQDLTEAELLFFDEFNRAHPRVLNAVMEIVQFRTINGTPLPNLKAVFAACNPAGAGYQVVELDPALLDRFPIHLQFASAPDRKWFRKRFPAKMGEDLYDWWTVDLDESQQSIISPRKLEQIGLLLQEGFEPQLSLPAKVRIPFFSLENRLNKSQKTLDTKDFIGNPKKYSSLVAEDMNVAMRFALLLCKMKPDDMYKVREITLSLPTETLSAMEKDCPFVFSKTCKSIADHLGSEESAAFKEMLEERIAVDYESEETTKDSQAA